MWVAVELMAWGMEVPIELGSVEVLAEWRRLPAVAGAWLRPPVTAAGQWQTIAVPGSDWSED